MRRFWGLAVCAVLLVGASFAVAGSGAGKPASLTLRDLSGAKVRLSDLKGKIVVINFWATWCGPCNVEMPLLVKASEKYGTKKVMFVGVSVDAPDSGDKLAKFVQRLAISYPVWLGATDEDMKRLQMGNEVPGTAFLDEDGVIRARILGQMRPGEIEERLDWLLRGSEGNSPALLVKHLEQ